MKIGIISDIHDNLTNLNHFLDLTSELKITGLICCGDITTPETLENLTRGFNGPIKLACGNMEIRSKEFSFIANEYPNLEVFEEFGVWQPKNTALNIAFIHRPNKIEVLAQTGKYDYIFYGHTHQPWIRVFSAVKEVTMANPGTLGGVFSFPTFAILDTETRQLELKKLYNN